MSGGAILTGIPARVAMDILEDNIIKAYPIPKYVGDVNLVLEALKRH